MLQFHIDIDEPVLVTGATGYLAGWLVRRLLEEGVTVHAAVRNPDDTRKTAHLMELAATLPGTLRLFKADLLIADSYLQAMRGCTVVFHTASPFVLDVKNAQRELLDPALTGTRNVLKSVQSTESVRRVVLTSSCAAIYGDNADMLNTTGGIFTETDWNTSSSLAHNPYSYSKTMAERDAWHIAQQQSRWQLVSINPSLVIGPGTNPGATSESFSLVRRLGDGQLKAGVPHLEIGLVDVRDVAEAHLRAAYLPAAKGRYIISAKNSSLLGLADALLPKFHSYPTPRRTLPKWLVWLAGPLANKATTRKFVTLNVGLPWRADNTKSIRELSMSYRPLRTTIQDMFHQMIDSGQIPTPK